MDVYKGGLTQPGKNLHPSADMEGEVSGVHGGEMKMGVSKSGPAVNSGGNHGKSFLDDKGYATGDMEIGRPSNMKTVNPDDISNSA